MNTIFDIGMYDGADAQHYLETGHRVIAVEANPALCAMVGKRLQKYVDNGQLVIENVAVSNQPGTIDLHICGQDLGSSSVKSERLVDRFPLGKYTVPTVTYNDLTRRYGRPMFMKVDIEGADKECVMSLTYETAPAFLSFEAHADVEELINYAHGVGYRYFKIIQQNSHRCIQNQDAFLDRVRMKIVRLAGYDCPMMVRRRGRLHMLGHSAGPPPWQSDGPESTKQQILDVWKRYPHRGWYDVHATTRRSNFFDRERLRVAMQTWK